MFDVICDFLACVGALWLIFNFARVLKEHIDSLPPDLPPPRHDPRDKRREWDRIQGR